MNLNKNTDGSSIAAEILRQLGTAGAPPRVALQIITGNKNAGNRGLNHTGRDVAQLRRLGIEPLKVGTRWTVPAHRIAAWVAGELTPRRVDLRTKEGRRLRKSKPQAAAASTMEG